MKIQSSHWESIRDLFRLSFRQNLHVSIASVDKSGVPTVTPLGTLFLNKDGSGFYFEKFITSLADNRKSNKNICILMVNTSKWFWFKSLFKEKFETHPAIKLYGELGEKRAATQKELDRLENRLRFTQRLKGHKYLWDDMNFVREIAFTKFEKMKLGKMTSHL